MVDNKESSQSPGEYQKLQSEGRYRVGADIPTIPFSEIGKRGVRRVDGYEKASGKAVYTRDVNFQGMLHARVLTSPHARARIISMDTSEAERLPGVRAIIRYDDPEVEGRILNGSYFGPDWVFPDLVGWALKPERPVLGSETWYHGQPVGLVVAADSEDVAREALRLTEVEWEILPFVLDQEEALKPNAPILRPGADSNLLIHPADERTVVTRGDVEKGFKEADKILEFKFKRDAYLWAGAEPPCVVLRWIGDKLEMWVHQQQPHIAKMLLSEWLNLPMNKIIIHTLYQGGSFGERGNPANNSENGINILAALLSRRAGKPVKLLYDRGQQFFGESGDIMVADFKVGTMNDGTITAVKINSLFAVYMCGSGIEHIIDNTKIPNILCESKTADVSKGPAWWFRCEHTPNASALTLVLDHVANELGLDPIEVAFKNDGCDGQDMTYLSEYKREHGFPDIDSLKECVEAGKKAINWDEKWHKPGTKRLSNGNMHGIGFTWNHDWDDIRGTGSAAVMIETDGTVSIIGQHSDIGINPWTAYCQVVADELGMRFEDVNIKPYDLEQGFALMTPDGSCNLVTNATIVRDAARKVKKMLFELAAQKFEGVKAEELDIKDGIVFVKDAPHKKKTIKEVVLKTMPTHVSCVYETEPPIIAWSWHFRGLWGEATETGRPRLCRQAHFMEVEVDTDTGEIEVKKVVNVNDVGKAVSPETVEGQMYGGTYMGLGRGLTEEMVWDEQTGVLLNRNLLNYKYATMLDCGPIETIIKETGMGHGPYGTCGIGEDTPTVMPGLIGPAVYNAIGKWIDDYPITPDKVLRVLGKA